MLNKLQTQSIPRSELPPQGPALRAASSNGASAEGQCSTAAFFQCSSVPMAILNEVGSISEANSAFWNLVGLEPNDPAPSIFDICSPVDAAGIRAGIDLLLRGARKHFQAEAGFSGADGTTARARLTLDFLSDDSERKFGLILHAVPDAEQSGRVEKLEKQISLLESMVSTTPDFVYLFDTAGRFQYANRRLLEVWGMELSEVLGKTCLELGYQEWHHNMHMREIAQVIETRQPIKGEVPFKAPLTGIFGVYEYIFTPVLNPQQNVTYIAGTTRDVTERKKTEEALRVSEERYRELFTCMTEGFCVLEKIGGTSEIPVDFRFVAANPAFPAQSGLHEVIGRTIREVIPGEAVDWIDIYDRVAVTGESLRFEREFSSQGRILEVCAYPLAEERQVGVVFHDITERRQVETKLRHQLHLTDTITRGAGEALFLLNPKGQVTFMNPAAESLFGWKQEELLGRVLHEVVHYKYPDGRPYPISSCPVEAVTTSGASLQGLEDVFFARDGSPVQVRCSNTPVYENGHVAATVLVVADITAQKADEERLQRAHDTFYHLIQNNPFGIYVVDADFRLRQVSAGARRVFSNVHPLLGRDFAEVLRIIWAEPFATEAVQRFRHTLETGEPYSSPSTIERRQDIAQFESYDWRIERLLLPDGRPGVVCYFYDLSERQRWEDALRKSEERFQIAARATNDVIWDWDLETNSIWWNNNTEQVLGYPPDRVGHSLDWWSQNIHPADQERVATGVQRVIAGSSSFWRDEYRFRRADGTYAEIFDRRYVLREKSGTAIRMIGAMQDLTERKLAEAALAEAQRELQRHATELEKIVAERTARLRETITELEALSYSISHDMRAPLRAMQGFAQALMEDYRPRLEGDGLVFLDRISSAAQRLDLLIQDVLLYSRVSREELELKPVDLESLMRETLRTYHPGQEGQVTVHSPLPTVLGHEAFLSQILSNLLTNALKFVARGEKPIVAIRPEIAGDHVKIWIEDQGIGIAPEHSQRIFQVFGRVYGDEDYPGTGIGLAIVKRAVEKLGGQVGVESVPGQGSRFWFTVRQARSSQPRTASFNAPS